MKISGLPGWLISGVMVFPTLILSGLLLEAVPGSKMGILYWVTIPSIVFEESFEVCCRSFSDSLIFNVVFIGVFWFGIGALAGLLAEKLKTAP